MITVSIFINGNPIFTRSAVNVGEVDVGEGEDYKPLREYRLDSGDIIQHNRKDGAVKLAIEMLKTIKEQK